MSDAKMTASLSIDPKYVEGEVQRIVKAAIVAALGNRERGLTRERASLQRKIVIIQNHTLIILPKRPLKV